VSASPSRWFSASRSHPLFMLIQNRSDVPEKQDTRNAAPTLIRRWPRTISLIRPARTPISLVRQCFHTPARRQVSGTPDLGE
jgi:hypothetical protein